MMSPNYSGQRLTHYENNQQCTFQVLREAVMEVEDFQVEDYYDSLKVNGVEYSGHNTPHGVKPEGTISWYSDYSVVLPGWRICPKTPGPCDV